MIFTNNSQHKKSLQIQITLTLFIIYSTPIHKMHKSEVNRMSYHSSTFILLVL